MANSPSSHLEKDDLSIFKAGYLMKKSKHMKTYRLRWMSLADTQLFISFKSRFSKEYTEVFDLRDYTKIKAIPSSNKFQLVSPDSHKTFKAKSESERSAWIKAINDVQKADSTSSQFHTKQMFWPTVLDNAVPDLYRCNENPSSSSSSECNRIQRLVFVLLELEKHNNYPTNIDAVSVKSLINDDLYSYSDIHLINDYLHVLKCHSAGNKMKTFFDVKKFHCDSYAECGASNRFFSDIEYFDDETKTNFDIEEIVSMHVIDMIHCNLFHDTYIKNKLCQESNEKFATNARFATNTKGNVILKNGCVASIMYGEIAPKFEYLNLESENINNINNINTKAWHVSRKYNDLKEEILNHLTIVQWDFVQHKALIYQQSLFSKQHFGDSDVYAESKKDNSGYLDDLNLIICLILLCDFKNITISLRNSNLRKHIQEKDNDLLKRRSEYYHFAKLSNSCVQKCGRYSAKRDKLARIYFRLFHIIEECGALGWLRMKWNYPISTVTNVDLLTNEKNGIIVEFNSDDTGVYFDCSLISKCYHAKEVLFMDELNRKDSNIVSAPLMIRNIGNVQQSRYSHIESNFIKTFHEFIQIIITLENKSTDYKNYDNMSIHVKKAETFINFIQNKFTDYKNCDNISMHVKKAVKNAVDLFFTEKKKYAINIGLLMRERKFLTTLFLSQDLKRIKFQFVSYLFPNCYQVTVYNTNKLGVIDASFMKCLFKSLRDIDECPIKQIVNSSLIIGFIRMQSDINNIFIPNEVCQLILLFYPTNYSKISNICFMDCNFDYLTGKKILTSSMDFVPRGWKLDMKVNTHTTLNVQKMDESCNQYSALIGSYWGTSKNLKGSGLSFAYIC